MGGGEGHGHGHGKPYEIPDWRTFRVEDAPQLVQVQKMLAQKGLKSPWLRNEVWRYRGEFNKTRWDGLKLFFGRGNKWGFALAVVTVAIGKLLSAGHDDGHEHESH